MKYKSVIVTKRGVPDVLQVIKNEHSYSLLRRGGKLVGYGNTLSTASIWNILQPSRFSTGDEF